MDVAIMGTLIPIIISIGVFITIVYIRKFQNLERMAIIEKGMDPGIFKKESSTAGTLRASFLLIGAGVGLLMGYWLEFAICNLELFFCVLSFFYQISQAQANPA